MSSTAPTLLTIPLELRLQIYEFALDHRLGYLPQYHLCISAVCQQIREEVLTVILRQPPLAIMGLPQLSKWTLRGSPHLLGQVQSIALEVSKEFLFSVTAAQPTCPIAENHLEAFTAVWWETKYAEQFRPFKPFKPPPVQRLTFRRIIVSKIQKAIGISSRIETDKLERPITSTWNALTSIMELKKLTIFLNDESSCFLNLDKEQKIVLDMISVAFPKLQELISISSLLPLRYLGNFHSLRLLNFSGYSKPTPKELLEILRSLKNLGAILITRFREYHDEENSIIHSQLSRYLSMTPEVLENIHPLKRFEIAHFPPGVASDHVTVPILNALRAHMHSLRTLSIHSEHPVNADFLKELLSFVVSSNLSSLSIQLNIPTELQALLDGDTIFPKNTLYREKKLSVTSPRFPLKDLVSVYVRAS